MTEHFASWDDVTLELAADLVTEGLDQADYLQLEASTRHDDLEAFEIAVAELALGGIEELEAPPIEVSERLRRSAEAWVAASTLRRDEDEVLESRIAATAPRPNPWVGAGGWLAAAAMAIAFFALRGADSAERAPSADELRGALVAQADDLLRHDWVNTEDPDSAGVSGEVVWSSERQEGYMVFEGLAPNDPSKEQYQLWVFDEDRNADETPVDGGVFDVDAEGRAVVKIDPKLDVRSPKLFAITIEKPGGVVVSQRERLVLISKASS